MAYREVMSVEIREIIRRWQQGISQRRIASGTGLSRQTVRHYIDAAEAAGLRPGGPGPSEEQLAALATLSSTRPRQAVVPSEDLLAPWVERIESWLTADRLQVTRVQELLAERGCEVSYTSLRRFIERRGWRRRQPVTVRMEDGQPGEVAEMDFGRLGLVTDPETGRRRTVWVLIVVWRYSRHCFVWPTTSQQLGAVLEGLEAAWASFESVPRYLLRMSLNCSIEELDGSDYSRVREWSGSGWIDVRGQHVKKRTISGRRLPMSVPAKVGELVLDIPAGNPAIWMRVVRREQ